MTDHEILERLKALDERDDIDLSSWEAGFLQGLLGYARPLSEKQRVVAVGLIEQYEVDSRSETITKLPPGAEKYFRKDLR